MKFLVGLVFLLAAQLVLADSFTVIRDGKEYLCQEKTPFPPPPPPTDPNGRLRCVEKAYSGPFSKSESERLCEGARNEAPANCGLKAYAGPFNKEEAIGLCLQARNDGPADCAIRAYAGPFSKSESLQLCYGGTVENAECAIRAYNGPYSKEEAIRLCRVNPGLVLRLLQ